MKRSESDQLAFDLEPEFSVSEFLDLLNGTFGAREFTVIGEIAEVNVRGKAVYIKLKDKADGSTLETILWTYNARRLGFDPTEGQEVKVVGKVQIYKPYGKLSLIISHISPLGEGALKAAFEKLKKDLEARGYFDEARKRELPAYPSHIGLITSRMGDARKDFLTHLAPYWIRVSFLDARVEGVSAIDSIVSALHEFNRLPASVDLIVLTRGGGSIESLQAFNSYEVAQAIFSSRIPVVSAVGHENDITIADLVADVRASTPTHAGQLVSRGYVDAASELSLLHARLINNFASLLSNFRLTTEMFTRNSTAILRTVRDKQQQLLTLSTRLDSDIRMTLTRSLERLEAQATLLDSNDPEKKISQGYSIVRDSSGHVVKDPTQLRADDILMLRMKQAVVSTQVSEVTPL